MKDPLHGQKLNKLNFQSHFQRLVEVVAPMSLIQRTGRCKGHVYQMEGRSKELAVLQTHHWHILWRRHGWFFKNTLRSKNESTKNGSHFRISDHCRNRNPLMVCLSGGAVQLLDMLHGWMDTLCVHKVVLWRACFPPACMFTENAPMWLQLLSVSASALACKRPQERSESGASHALETQQRMRSRINTVSWHDQ